jgi:hypothetical protein
MVGVFLFFDVDVDVDFGALCRLTEGRLIRLLPGYVSVDGFIHAVLVTGGFNRADWRWRRFGFEASAPSDSRAGQPATLLLLYQCLYPPLSWYHAIQARHGHRVLSVKRSLST